MIGRPNIIRGIFVIEYIFFLSYDRKGALMTRNVIFFFYFLRVAWQILVRTSRFQRILDDFIYIYINAKIKRLVFFPTAYAVRVHTITSLRNVQT